MTGQSVPPSPVPVGGRRKREEGGRRHVTKVVMSDEERAQVEGRAIALGISIPRALVEAATGVPPLTRTERKALHAELTGIKLLLGNLTNNVNQIARALNSNADRPTREIRAVLERAAVAAARVEQMAEEYRTS
ncbi:hypothetical protein [Streptomyces alboflavus]|uniref:hypothetical protein n=1 Tax=Streptomyces alboflavus TaxID=67267 RepID=UPI000F656251|nr:hypothetical protein [Streptomyces alboflavus]